MSNIGTMAVNFIAKTFGFDRNVDKSRQKYNRFTKDVRSSKADFKAMDGAVGKLGVSLSGLLAAGSAAQMFRLFDGTMQQADALGKAAQMLDVSVSALDRYHFAASRAGITTSEVDNALRKMEKRLGEARYGTGRLYSFFQKMGVSLERFLKMKPERAFEQFGYMLNRIRDPMEKVAAAATIFGDQAGPKMIRFFENGNLGQASRDLERLGGALTEEDARNAAKYVDTMGDLTRQLTRLKHSAAALAGPEVTGAIAQLVEGIGIARDAMGQGTSKKAGGFHWTDLIGMRWMSIGKLRQYQTSMLEAASNRDAPTPLNARQAAAQQGPGGYHLERWLMLQHETQRAMLAEQRKLTRDLPTQLHNLPTFELHTTQLD